MKLAALYPIVNVEGTAPAACERALDLAKELAAAGVKLVQLRAKSLSAGALTALTGRFVDALHGSGALVILNDRVDVAVAAGAAGVHLGDEDLPVHAARQVVKATGIEGFLIGYSTHSVEEAAKGASTDADYLGFGPVFESPTKAGIREARGLELLAEACRASHLPVVAIGGVTIETAVECWKAGAASVAVISEIERASDRRKLVAAYRAAARSAGL